MSETRVGRPRSAAVDQAINDAVLDLLIEGGIDAVGFEQVARRAGVTRATVYRRHPTRNDLLIAAILHSHREQLEGPDGEVESPAEPTVEDMIATFAVVLSRPRERRLLRRLAAGLPDHPDLFAAYRRISSDERDQAMRDCLQRAKDRGEFPAEADVEMLRILIAGAISVHLTTQPDDISADELADYLRKCLVELGYRRADDQRRTEGRRS